MSARFSLVFILAQAFSFANTRRAKNGPAALRWRAICGNVAEKHGNACLLFGV